MIAPIALALIVATTAATPSPAPITNTYMRTGAERDLGPVEYNSFPRPAGGPVTLVKGYMSNYSLLTEKQTTLPSASVMFEPEDHAAYGGVIFLAFPLRINGHTYECNGRSSEFERRFHACPTLPPNVLGKSHPVYLGIYRTHALDGSWAYAASEIQTIKP